ncbi:MAG TPA: hypothetical protein VFM18_24505, partial [Methanosarcina sp.]|nr:hypothetical protein [Methanosarcina sp.]
ALCSIILFLLVYKVLAKILDLLKSKQKADLEKHLADLENEAKEAEKECKHVWSKDVDSGNISNKDRFGRDNRTGFYFIKECEKCKSIKTFKCEVINTHHNTD